MLNTTQINEIVLSLMPTMRGMFRKLHKGNDADVEDAVQDACLHLIEYVLPKFREGNVEGYAMTACKRLFLNDQRSHARSRTDAFVSGAGPDAITSGFCLLSRVSERLLLERAMQSLNASERALCAAYLDSGEWLRAAEAVGVSQVRAHRMKVSIQGKVARLK